MLRACGRAASLLALLCSRLPGAAVSVHAARSSTRAQLTSDRVEECSIPLTPSYLRTMTGCNGKEAYSFLRTGDCTNTKWVMTKFPHCMEQQDGIIKIIYKSDESDKRATSDSMQVLVDNNVKGTWTNTNCTSPCSGFVAWNAENTQLMVQAQSGTTHGDTHMSIEKMYFVPGPSAVPQVPAPATSKAAAAPTPEVAAPPTPKAAAPPTPQAAAPPTPEKTRTRAVLGGAMAEEDPECAVPLTPSSFRTAAGCNAKAMYKSLRTGDCTSTRWTSRQIPACMSGFDGLINISFTSDESDRRDISDWMLVLVDDGVSTKVNNTDCHRGCSLVVPWSANNERLVVQAQSSTGHGELHMSIDKMQFIPAGEQPRREEDVAPQPQEEKMEEVTGDEEEEEPLDPDEAWEAEDEAAQEKFEAAKRKKAAKEALRKRQKEQAKETKAVPTVASTPLMETLQPLDSRQQKEAVVDEASAKGDPHVTNVHGDRYDIQQHGPLTLLLLPRGAAKKNALLRVWALTKGTLCGPKYIDKLIVAGHWVEEKKHVGKTGEVESRWLFHTNEEWSNPKSPNHRQHARLGPGVELVISHGKTDTGILYLNFQAHQLARAGVSVGGLLGVDEHSWAATQPDLCARSLSLNSRRTGTDARSASTLLATFD